MKINDTVVGAGFVAAGALIIVGTLNYPSLDGGHPGPALFPRILGGLMAAFGGLLGVDGLRSREAWASDWLSGRPLANALLVLVSVVAYMAVVDLLGFLLTASLIMFLLMWWLRVRPLTSLVVAVGLALGVYIFFARILLVPLARGLLSF